MYFFGFASKVIVFRTIRCNFFQFLLIEEIRKQTDSVDVLYTIYVVDNNDRLIGELSLKKLIISHPLARVEEIYEQGEFQFGLDSMWRAGTGFLCLVLPRTFIDPGFRALSTPSVSFESVVVPSGLPENVPNDPSKTGPIKKDDTVVGLDDTRADKKKPQ
jgi:hypothetical protein